MLFLRFIIVLLRAIATVFCGVAPIFCSIIIIYFTCHTDACFANFLLHVWTVCLFHQNNVLQTIMGIYYKTMFHIFLAVNFICVSLMGDREWMCMIFGKERVCYIGFLGQLMSQKDSFTFEWFNLIF